MLIGILLAGRLQHLDGALVIAQVGVHHPQAGKRVFVVGLSLERLPEGILLFRSLGRSTIETPQNHPTLGVLGLLRGDDLVLLDSLLQVVFVDAAILRISGDHPKVDPRQHPPRVQIIGILLEYFFGLRNGIPQMIGLDVQIRQLFENDAGRRVHFQRFLVVLNGLAQVVGFVAISLRQFRIHPAHGKVVVSAGFFIRRLGHFRVGLGECHRSQGQRSQKRFCCAKFCRANHEFCFLSTAGQWRPPIILLLYTGVRGKLFRRAFAPSRVRERSRES